MYKSTLILMLCLGLIQPVEAKIKRSYKAITVFKNEYACPSTGRFKGKCPGYVIDHVEPLCAGGLDDPINMQWQLLAESKIKDKLEHKICRQH